MPDVWLSQSSETVGTLSIIQIFFLLSTHHELGFRDYQEGFGLSFELFLASAAALSAAALSAAALSEEALSEEALSEEALSEEALSEEALASLSDAALLAEVASNCRTVSTIFVPLTLNV